MKFRNDLLPKEAREALIEMEESGNPLQVTVPFYNSNTKQVEEKTFDLADDMLSGDKNYRVHKKNEKITLPEGGGDNYQINEVQPDGTSVEKNKQPAMENRDLLEAQMKSAVLEVLKSKLARVNADSIRVIGNDDKKGNPDFVFRIYFSRFDIDGNEIIESISARWIGEGRLSVTRETGHGENVSFYTIYVGTDKEKLSRTILDYFNKENGYS